MTRTILPALSLLVLGSLALLGVILLAALGHPVPDVLPTLATVCLSALAGLAVPSLAAATSTSWTGPDSGGPSSSSTPAAAAAAAPAAPVYLVASQNPATAGVNTTAGGSGIRIVAGELDAA